MPVAALGASLTALVVAAAVGAGAPAPEAAESGAPYVPSPHSIVTRMLELAEVDAGDYVIDLGSGDGRIVLTAAKVFGARGLGVELRGDLVASSRRAAQRQGVESRVRFEQQDLFETDISEASLVTVYLLPETLRKLRGKLLRELSPGTRVMSHDYPLENWRPEHFEQFEHAAKVDVTGTARTNLYLYRVPAYVEGTWQASLPPQIGLGAAARLVLQQAVTSGTGTLESDRSRFAVEDLRITGRQLEFRLPDLGAEFSASVDGRNLEGIVYLAGQRLRWKAALQH